MVRSAACPGLDLLHTSGGRRKAFLVSILIMRDQRSGTAKLIGDGSLAKLKGILLGDGREGCGEGRLILHSDHFPSFYVLPSLCVERCDKFFCDPSLLPTIMCERPGIHAEPSDKSRE